MDEQKAQELVRQTMKRAYMHDPFRSADEEPRGLKVYIDGDFSPDELEAMAWCMRNDKWPRRT